MYHRAQLTSACPLWAAKQTQPLPQLKPEQNK